ncbi:hypothetical protein GDO81_005285 [Engystomops pustulosus]|uniref:Uncharacterized protein n=1 Tax=Engystomops pustulosus TaxID=76066 RepID=A0AAV7CPT1_ENGPU|nr:hypothetical protein GDO81_005285 [Engystomops pustulosus]
MGVLASTKNMILMHHFPSQVPEQYIDPHVHVQPTIGFRNHCWVFMLHLNLLTCHSLRFNFVCHNPK